jgi:hypothetical protein
MISDNLTQGTKFIGHVFHPTTIVTDAEIVLLEDMEPGVELQNVGLTVVKELGLEREPWVTSGLRRFLNDLVEFRERVSSIHITTMLSNLAQ